MNAFFVRASATLFTTLIFALTLACSKPEPPRVLRGVSPFELTAQDGAKFGSKELAGEPYLVSFFFTSCATVCPPVMEEMKHIQDELIERKTPTRLVSITVDPEHDSPERLTAYASKLGAESSRWTFLTGPHALVQEVVVDRLMTHMGEEEEGPGGLVDIGHGSHVLVIDGKGQLRGIHEPIETNRKQLLETLDILADERP